MLKTYELMERHFGWEKRPAAGLGEGDHAVPARTRAACRRASSASIRSAISKRRRKPAVRRLIERRVRRKELMPVALEGAEKTAHWARPETLDAVPGPPGEAWFTSSRRSIRSSSSASACELFFGYEHRFEAYVPKEKRRFGYFALPVLMGDDDRRRHRPEGGPREAEAADAEMDLGRPRLGPSAQAGDRGGAAPLRALPARHLSAPSVAGRIRARHPLFIR